MLSIFYLGVWVKGDWLIYFYNYNLRYLIMNDTLNKTFGQQSGSAKSHLDTVQALCKDTMLLHDHFHQDLTRLTGQISTLKDKVKKNSHDLRKFFVQKITPAEDTLVVSHEAQLHDNKSMQQTMTEIKRENRETGEAIVKTFEKLKYLQKKIGQYH